MVHNPTSSSIFNSNRLDEKPLAGTKKPLAGTISQNNIDRTMMIRVTSIALTFALYGYAADAAGCHPTYSSSTTYDAGDWVSASTTVETTTTCTCGTSGCPTSPGQTTGCASTTSTTEVHNYQCVSGPASAFCAQSGFAPGGEFSSTAWTKESAVCTVRFSTPFPSSSG